MELRPAAKEDLPAILRIDRETPEAPHWPEAEYAGRLSGGDPARLVSRCLYVATLGERVVGYAAARVVAGEAELESIAVADSARRLGIGRALCHSLLTWSRALGATVMDLEVRAGSEAPRRLYAELGFEAIGLRSDYYREPVDDAVLMRVTL